MFFIMKTYVQSPILVRGREVVTFRPAVPVDYQCLLDDSHAKNTRLIAPFNTSPAHTSPIVGIFLPAVYIYILLILIHREPCPSKGKESCLAFLRA